MSTVTAGVLCLCGVSVLVVDIRTSLAVKAGGSWIDSSAAAWLKMKQAVEKQLIA